jgi:hypothetical protein
VTRSWLEFSALNTVAAAALGCIGQAMAAAPFAGAVWAGTLASFVGALAGSLPLAKEIDAISAGAGRSAAAIGKATLLRLAVTIAGGLVAGFVGRFDRRTLLFSLAATYLALLAVETGWFLKQARKERKTS